MKDFMLGVVIGQFLGLGYLFLKKKIKIDELLCKIGIHSWTYRYDKTGIYCHPYWDGTVDYRLNKRDKKCEICKKRK